MRGPFRCRVCGMPFTLAGPLLRCWICKAATNPERAIVGPGAAVVAICFAMLKLGGIVT